MTFKYKKWFSIIAILALLSSCSSDKSPANIESVLHINPEIVDNSGFIDIVDSIRLIPLETIPEATIGHIVKVESYKNRFYLYDYQFTKFIFIYDTKGKWINTISSIGKGPAEYVQPRDMAIDRFNNELIIVDPSTKKILKYDLNGEFKSELKLDFLAYAIGFVDKDTYAIKSMDEERNPVLVSVDHNGQNRKIIHSGIFEFNMGSFHHFTWYNGKQLYIEHLNDTIYSLTKDTAKPYLYVDFMDLKMTPSYQDELIQWARQNKWMPRINDSKAGEIVVYIETDEFLRFGCRYKGKSSVIICNKENQKQYMYQREARGQSVWDKLLFSYYKVNDSGGFYGFITTDTYLDLIENEEFNDLLIKGVAKVEEQGFMNQKEVKLESNPVLSVVYFKNQD